jgi:hypothetical protein
VIGIRLLDATDAHLAPDWPGYPATEVALVRDLLGRP